MNMDLISNNRDLFSVNLNQKMDRLPSLQHICRSKLLNSVTLGRVKCISKLPLPNLLKEYLCSFNIPQDFDLDGFYIDYHCNFPNHVHHKVHQIHPGKCQLDGSKVLIKSQHLYLSCSTCDSAGKCTMTSTADRDAWLNLKHKNLMQCHMAMNDPLDQRVCLVFEFPGITLQDFVFRMFLAKQQVPEIISWQVLAQLSSVLIYLENNGVLPWELCHPQNVMITNNGEVKLENLLLYLPTQAGSKYQTNTSRHVSPEQIKGEGVTSKTLVWGLGCILYEITARLPRSLSTSGLSQFPPLCYTQAISCAKELSKVMCECLRNNPCSRPSLLSLKQISEKRVRQMTENNLTNGTNMLNLMRGLDRLPLSGGFLRR